jgi:hypothetical protein
MLVEAINVHCEEGTKSINARSQVTANSLVGPDGTNVQKLRGLSP